MAGLAAMVVGAWGPWVAHRNAGMALGVPDLVEFVKFMQRAGLTAVVREWFYLPLLAAAVGTALWSARRLQASRWKWPVIGAAALLPLVALPPYPALLEAYRSPEDHLSFWLSMAAWGWIAAASRLGRRLPRRLAAAVLVVLGLGSSAATIWQFVQLSRPLAELYGAPLQIGWGLIVTAAGSGLLAAGALMQDM